MKSRFLINFFVITFFTICFVFDAVKLSSLPFEGSVLSLLQNEKQSAEEKFFLERLDNEILFLVSSSDPKNAVEYFSKKLKDSGLFSKVIYKYDEDFLASTGKFLSQHKSAFLNDAIREELQTKPERFVLNVLYRMAGNASGAEFSQDPLLLIRRELSSLYSKSTSIEMKDGMACFNDDGIAWYPVRATSLNGGFSVSATQTVQTINKAIAATNTNFKDTRILKRGTVFYSEHAQQKAQQEISILGSVTLIGVFLILIFFFRSLYPVVLVAIAMLCAVITGIAALFMFFDKVHPSIFVPCLCIIGISSDYTVYYMVRRRTHPKENSFVSVYALKNELIAAFLTTAIAYLLLLFSPFPLLKGISIFCVAGLLGAISCVFFIEPYLCTRQTRAPVIATKSIASLLNLFSGRKNRTIVILLGLFTILALPQIQFNDDPALLQEQDPQLQKEDNLTAKITGMNFSQSWIIVRADDERSLRHQLSALNTLTAELQKKEIIAKVELPPINTDEDFLRDKNIISLAMQNLAAKLSITGLKLNLNAYTDDSNVSCDEFFKSAIGQRYAPFFLEPNKEHKYAYAAQVNIAGDVQVLSSAIKDAKINATVIDRRHDFSTLFEQCRHSILILLTLALVAICLLQSLRLGVKKGIKAFFQSLLSVAFASAISVPFDQNLNLFSVAALILVLGTGIDYIWFFSNPNHKHAHTLFAVTVCVLTTILSLGVLSFSSTYAVRSFGITLTAGITAAYLCAVCCRDSRS